MSIVNGQPVEASVNNTANMSRLTDTSTIGKVALNNAAVESGPSISNAQQLLNELADAVGVTGVGDAGRNLYSSNEIVSDGDDRKEAIEKLDATFHTTTGHNHDGTPGNGPRISAAALVDYNQYYAEWQGISVTGAAGSSINITAQMIGKVETGSATQVGVITNAPNNKCHIYNTSTQTFIEDAQGQRVYGRVTYSVGVWTLSFYTNEAGVETAHTLSSSNITVLFLEVFNSSTRPTIPSSPFEFGTLDVTADVIDATTSLKGKVQLQSAVSTSIGAANTVGITNGTVANADHAHQGVHSLAIFGDATQAFNDVQIEQGDNVTLSWSSGRIKIDAAGGVAFQEAFIGTANGINPNFGPLTYTPANDDSILVLVDYVAVPRSGYTVSGSNITFLAGWIPASGQTVYAYYMTSGIPSSPSLVGTLKVEYLTLNAGHIAAKGITLASLPSSPNEVMVDVIGGTAQMVGDDFIVTGTLLDWTGLGLELILTAGDKLRVSYIT